MNYQYLNTHKELFPDVIGITSQQFEELLPKFRKALRKAEYERVWGKPRVREPGGGRKATLKTDSLKLLFILFYYKVYPTFRFAQTVFCFDKRNVQLWVRFLEKVLFEALGYQLELPAVRVKHLQHWFEVCPALKESLVDATERPVRRPKNPKANQRYYSGKKKRHTVKNQLLVQPKTRRILAVSETVEGKLHDKKLLEKDPLFLKFPPGSRGIGDSGYQGVKHPFVKLVTPKKKPPGGKLTDEEKKINKAISSIRTRVEHPISYLKHFNILAHPFRSQIRYAHQPFQTIACLYNFTRTHR